MVITQACSQGRKAFVIIEMLEIGRIGKSCQGRLQARGRSGNGSGCRIVTCELSDLPTTPLLQSLYGFQADNRVAGCVCDRNDDGGVEGYQVWAL